MLQTSNFMAYLLSVKLIFRPWINDFTLQFYVVVVQGANVEKPQVFSKKNFMKKNSKGTERELLKILERRVLMQFTMASLRHILMGRNDDYFLNYIAYSKIFDAVLKLLLVI